MKQLRSLAYYVIAHVTPFVGVWIETFNILVLKSLPKVTPFVGVWIETHLPHWR